ncbi:hypothetical protein ACFFJN_21620 [Erwinia mallotivora]|uniref:hypothetical protein n=1 Tax=Erwinia mallotivora TaxID=69222 RepID=UPI0035E8E26A
MNAPARVRIVPLGELTFYRELIAVMRQANRHASLHQFIAAALQQQARLCCAETSLKKNINLRKTQLYQELSDKFSATELSPLLAVVLRSGLVDNSGSADC